MKLIPVLKPDTEFHEEKRGELKRPFTWITADFKVLTVKEMRTGHIFNCVRMLWNNTVPERYRFQKYKRYSIGMPMHERVSAVRAFLTELKQRKDLLPHEIEELNVMCKYAHQNLQYRLE